MKTEFEVGDVVVLKSGGPEMTIYEISSDKTVASCGWFSNVSQEYFTRNFIVDTLAEVK